LLWKACNLSAEPLVVLLREGSYILHISVRERELLDRLELQGEDTPEIRDEINELRAKRGEPPLPNPVR
jgi:hypothetical protein